MTFVNDLSLSFRIRPTLPPLADTCLIHGNNLPIPENESPVLTPNPSCRAL